MQMSLVGADVDVEATVTVSMYSENPMRGSILTIAA